MHSMVLEYFNKVFDAKESPNFNLNEEGEEVVSEDQNRELILVSSFEEFTMTIKQMHPDKASGPDGLNPAFFQNF